MTIPTITDDLIAEIEAAAKQAESYREDVAPAVIVRADMLISMANHIRQLEKDAARFAWLAHSDNISSGALLSADGSTLQIDELRESIDNAMQAAQ